MMPMIRSEEELENALSEPSPEVIETLRRLPGDIMLLGVGGKMGLSLASMVRRASDTAGVRRRVIGVSRFSDGRETLFHAHGIETIRGDLLNKEDLNRLPDAANIVFMTGMKFGSSGDLAMTWAMNCHLPALVCDRFRGSRIVAFSTGNVYGLTPVNRGGSCEKDVLDPIGEYAMSCVGRERVFEYFSRSENMPVALVRLNYACDLRYGVLVDLARHVWSEKPIDLTMGFFNTIWQGDANAQALRTFDLIASPPTVVNMTGPETLKVRDVCEQFGQCWNKRVHFTGAEADTALLSNTTRAIELFGPPRVMAEQLLEWVAHWVEQGGRNLGKATHFESRTGRF